MEWAAIRRRWLHRILCIIDGYYAIGRGTVRLDINEKAELFYFQMN